MKKSIIRAMCVMVLLGIGGMARADIYISAGGYASSVDAANAALHDDGDFVPAVFLGWRPIELVGVEAGYYALGSYDGPGLTIKANAKTLAGLLSMEIGPVGIYLKGGMANTTVEVNGAEDSSTDPFGGVGVTADIMDRLYVYAEALRFTGEHSGNNADFDTIGAGLRFSF